MKKLIKKYKKRLKSENKNISFQTDMDYHLAYKKTKDFEKAFQVF